MFIPTVSVLVSAQLALQAYAQPPNAIYHSDKDFSYIVQISDTHLDLQSHNKFASNPNVDFLEKALHYMKTRGKFDAVLFTGDSSQTRGKDSRYRSMVLDGSRMNIKAITEAFPDTPVISTILGNWDMMPKDVMNIPKHTNKGILEIEWLKSTWEQKNEDDAQRTESPSKRKKMTEPAGSNVGIYALPEQSKYEVVQSKVWEHEDDAKLPMHLRPKHHLTKERLEVFITRGYLSYTITDSLTIITINSMFYYLPSKAGEDGLEPPQPNQEVDPVGQFQYLRKKLQQLRESGKSAIIATHVPPAHQDYDGLMSWQDRFITYFIKIIVEFCDVIKSSISAHFHKNDVRVLQSSLMKNQDRCDRHIHFIGGAITTLYKNNPSMTVYKYSNKEKRIVDYDLHYLPMMEHEGADLKDLTWEKYGSATEIFELKAPILTAHGIEEFNQEMRKNDKLLEKYLNFKMATYKDVYKRNKENPRYEIAQRSKIKKSSQKLNELENHSNHSNLIDVNNWAAAMSKARNDHNKLLSGILSSYCSIPWFQTSLEFEDCVKPLDGNNVFHYASTKVERQKAKEEELVKLKQLIVLKRRLMQLEPVPKAGYSLFQTAASLAALVFAMVFGLSRCHQRRIFQSRRSSPD